MTNLRPRRPAASSGVTLALLLAACGGDAADPGSDPAVDTITDATADAPDATGADAPEGSDASDDSAAEVPDTTSEPDAAEPDTTDGSDDPGDDLADVPEPRALDPYPAWVAPPACGTPTAAGRRLVAAPDDPGHDAELGAKARQYDRLFHAISAYGVSVNTDVSISLDDTGARDAIVSFAQGDDGWDFEAATGRSVESVVSQFHKVAGAYAGVGVAADAFRYASLRDSGAECVEVEVARAHLRADLDALHLATAITGVDGVIARGFARRDLPGAGDVEIVPLADGSGGPLPEEKNNGTWREDNSGLYPGWIWEDSCSRDMLIGWVIGMAATWETIRDDPEFDAALKSRLQADAEAIARSLMIVGGSGYDLEIHDADGRLTYHAYLNENSVDRTYIRGARNGFHSMMAIGIVGGLAWIAEDPDVERWLYDELIDARGVLDIAATNMVFVDLGVGSNYSNYNMAFQGAWLASRYLRDPAARARAVVAATTGLYDRPPHTRQPTEQGQTFYDFVYAAAQAGASAFGPGGDLVDASAVARGLDTLRGFPTPPYWDIAIENCDEAEIAARRCVGIDGSEFELLGYAGRNGTLVSAAAIPFTIRPPSNYTWRSNPYVVNGGGNGSGMLPGVDFRFAYWLGRHTRLSGAE